ncbi:MAG TPA: IPT/TIG domain-containing protein [Blastocatellia bacterium]|nr:IPT/TIG domain-containing protein [Blastocatellia bacterium]
MKLLRLASVPLALCLATGLPASWTTLKAKTLSVGRTTAQDSFSSTEPAVTNVQVLFQGNPASNLIAGTDARQYRLAVTGTGFHHASQVLLDGRKARTVFTSPTQLTAKVKPVLLEKPGDLILSVQNPDGTTSNTVIVDVVSPPSVLSVTRLSADAGPPGATITITGTGFTPTGNFVRLVHSPLGDRQGIQADVPSSDGQTLQFTVTNELCPACVFTNPACAVACLLANPGGYRISITNANGLSNGLDFILSSTNGPIGVWGSFLDLPGPVGRAAVSDSSITFDGLCFTGSVAGTLVTDASGNFNLSGTFTSQVGPAGQNPRPAQYSGSVSNGVMILTITTQGTTLGPFRLVFGNDIVVPKPCV